MVTIKLPESVNTLDMGLCKIAHSESASTDTYVCPLCWFKVDRGESHEVIVPIQHEQLRKHVHTACLRAYLEHKLDITLFTKQFQKVDGYAGRKR